MKLLLSQGPRKLFASRLGKIMASQKDLRCFRSRFVCSASRALTLAYSSKLLSAIWLSLLLTWALPARAQVQQPFVFAVNTAGPSPGILVFSRNDATGLLTPVSGSPFPSKAPVNRLALDFNGRFLFAATSVNNIEMYTINSSTGALQEVPNSPFASTHTSSPAFLSTESIGQFLYVIDLNGSHANVSAVESFQIDSVNLDLIPTSAGSTDLPGLFAGGATHPSGKSFYVMVSNPSNPSNQPFLLFNSSNGTFTLPNVLPSNVNVSASLALDPGGHYLTFATSSDQLIAQSLLSDGTLGSATLSASIPGTPDSGPGSMIFDALGQFLYVSLPTSSTGGQTIHFYLPSTLLELPGSPLPSAFPGTTSWNVDPTGPFVYADKVYQVDPQSGVPSPVLPASPLPQPNFLQAVVFGVPPGSQPIVGPVARLSPSSLIFGSLTVGQTSNSQTVTISSTGGQALSLNTITITGANAADFSITGNNCNAPAVLQTGSSCSVLISFAPSAAGARSAALTITDNASPTTQSASLAGTGLAPAPAVTLMPGTLNFGTVTQGTSTFLKVTVRNAGTTVLHIASVVVNGANSSDYTSSSPSCNAAIPVNSACTIAVTFTPLAPGVRSAVISLTDDAPGSPQTIDATGNANPAVTGGPAPGGSTAATVSAGQPAHYQLQLTPGPGFTGTVSLTCSGVPLGASCQAPSSVSLTNGTATTFTVTVTTSGSAGFPSPAPRSFRRIPAAPVLRFLTLALLILLLLKIGRILESGTAGKSLAGRRLFASVALCACVGVAGCGGGSAVVAQQQSPPPPVVTPAGTSTITITPAATSASGQPLQQLQPIQLTLTVN